MTPSKPPTAPTPAPRIRWHAGERGEIVAWLGYAGTVNAALFQILRPLKNSTPGHRFDEWALCATLPGAQGKARYAYSLEEPQAVEELKAQAEHWLEEFVASLGAIFPAPAFEFGDDEGEPLEVMYAPGRRVRYVHPDWGYPGEQEPAAELLVLGAAYTIAQHSIGQSRTDLILEGIPGEWFNSVLFEPADDEKADRTAPAALVCESCGKPVERTFDDEYQHTTTQAGVSCTVYPVVAVLAAKEPRQ